MLQPASGEKIHLGMDFNVDNMAAVGAVKRVAPGTHPDGALVVFREFTEIYDTPTLCRGAKEVFKGHSVLAYPDAAGRSRDTRGATVSDYSIIKDHGFVIKSKPKNPPIKDRVAAVNLAFEQNKLFVDCDACPNLAEALEQQTYKNGLPDKTTGLDHILDALGYLVSYIYPVRNRKPIMAVVKQ